jgi:hypothetical protein
MKYVDERLLGACGIRFNVGFKLSGYVYVKLFCCL